MAELTCTQIKTPWLLDLPEEILLQIFGYFSHKDGAHADPIERWRFSADLQPPDRASLQSSRLVCRRLESLVSPLLSPVARVSLHTESMVRMELMSRNRAIARGIRAVEVDMRYRPQALAINLTQYHKHARKLVSNMLGKCDYETEFANFDDDDESAEAIKYRANLKAMKILGLIDYSWHAYLQGLNGDESDKERVQTEIERGNISEAHQKMLQECFDTYAMRHADQTSIISNGSFIETLTTILSRCASAPFIWFTDTIPDKYGPRDDALAIANDNDLLKYRICEAQGWLDIETNSGRDEQPNLLPPARILTDLPLACHAANIRLRGFSVGCFPLTKSFGSLTPTNLKGTNQGGVSIWDRLAVACRDLKIFHFAWQGMNCTPARDGPVCIEHRSIIDAYIGAVCSSPRLESFCLNMASFRHYDSTFRALHPDRHYLVTPILSSLTSDRLRALTVMDVAMNGADLATVTSRISASSTISVYLCGITLSNGRYREAMEVLRTKATASSDPGSNPRVMLNTLRGAEFGPPSVLDKHTDWMFGGGGLEAVQDYFDRLEEHTRPALLKRVEAWVNNSNSNDIETVF